MPKRASVQLLHGQMNLDITISGTKGRICHDALKMIIIEHNQILMTMFYMKDLMKMVLGLSKIDPVGHGTVEPLLNLVYLY